MIVFTATNLQTQDVYVGTARESVEEEWADLLSQAENGTSGQFFQQLREYGAAGFEVDTWAYGESPAEARESMREAREELGAQPIKSSRGKSAGRSTQAVQSASMKALMAAFEEAMNEEGALDEEDALEGLTSDSRKKAADKVSQETGTPSDTVEVSPNTPDTSSLSPQPSQSSQAVESRQVVDDSPVIEEESSADDEQKMLARLEAMKAAQARLLRERESGASTVSGKTGVKAAKPTPPEKLASGRTGSAAKEKRIRDAIEAERERRENLRQISSRDEHAEMNAVMARIEMRRMATKKANAEKAKQAAAARRAKQKADARKEASASFTPQDAAGSGAITPRATTATRSSASKSAATGQKSTLQKPAQEPSKLKMAAGRTGSSAKEKRIKEAIEQEKAARMAEKQAQRAAEAEEMANILARLEARTKEAEKIKRRR